MRCRECGAWVDPSWWLRGLITVCQLCAWLIIGAAEAEEAL